MTADELTSVLDLHARWLRGASGGKRADLARANLADADLARANLADADLARANLADADLTGADLARANLTGADLARANLADADLARANLAHAYLADADLARANLAHAYLADANLADADLARANLADADLTGACGNMCEIKSAQFDTWSITWTCAPDGVTTLQIGCQRHALDLWIKSDPRWIAAMDSRAADWWGKYRDVVLALVQASPATPYGAVQQGACVEAVE